MVDHARLCRERGETLGDISGRLGLVESTLARWLRAGSREAAALVPAFRAVSVIDGSTGSADATLLEAISVVTPRGYRVEDLDVDSLTRRGRRRSWPQGFVIFDSAPKPNAYYDWFFGG